MTEKVNTLNINKRLITILIASAAVSLAGSVFMLFYAQCNDIHGDGYAMGTDPAPVTIGRSCSPPLIDRLVNMPNESVTLLAVFGIALLSIAFANLMSFKILNFKLTKNIIAACLATAIVVAIFVDTLLLLTLYLWIRA